MRQCATKPLEKRDNARLIGALSLLLLLSTILVFHYVLYCDFVNFDDDTFVVNNTFVQRGLTWEGVKWAFATAYPTSWQPLIWLSRMVDVEIFGMAPWGHHLSNLVLHCANVLLLFLLLYEMTGAIAPAFIASLLFAVHPLHVEPVAWVSARKDVLSTLFWLLTMWAYYRYALTGSSRWYGLMLALFVLGLMSKAMLVTVPVVLLLVDYWPLERIPVASSGSARGLARRVPKASSLLRILVEKAPLAAFAAASSTLVLYSSTAGMETYERIGLGARVANALTSYVVYLRQAAWPSGLCFLYPHPLNTLPLSAAAASALLLLSLTGVILWARRRRYLVTGWFWYLTTLAPVIGVIQMGVQARADRFTYVPLIGVFIIVAWGGVEIAQLSKALRLPLAVAGVVAAAALGAVAFVQTRYWKNSIALMTRAVEVTTGNYMAENNLGSALYVAGRHEEARAAFLRALEINPRHPESLYNLGRLYLKTGQLIEAAARFREALEYTPTDPDTHSGLAVALLRLGKQQEGVTSLKRALALDPSHAEARLWWGRVLVSQGKLEEAKAYLPGDFVAQDGGRAQTFYLSGQTMLKRGDIGRAIEYFRKALEIDPEMDAAKRALERALSTRRE